MKVIIDKINERLEMGKPYSIVAVAEGIEIHGSKMRPASFFSHHIEKETGIETRETVLGYVQRGGSPSAFDRNLGTQLGGHATTLINEGKFGRMASVKGRSISDVPLSEVAGKLRLVRPDDNLIIEGKRIGISFGISEDKKSDKV